MEIINPPGTTPLDPNELDGLIPDFITTQGELNSLEADNIYQGRVWAFSKKRKNILTDAFLRQLHKKMFGEVWRWAGLYRKTEKNIGVDPIRVSVEVRKLCDDTLYWLVNKTFPWTELAARFHHRLVFIHPFPNGNGRHARLATDILLYENGESMFTWGKKMTRLDYIKALREADKGKFSLLFKFVRS